MAVSVSDSSLHFLSSSSPQYPSLSFHPPYKVQPKYFNQPDYIHLELNSHFFLVFPTCTFDLPTTDFHSKIRARLKHFNWFLSFACLCSWPPPMTWTMTSTNCYTISKHNHRGPSYIVSCSTRTRRQTHFNRLTELNYFYQWAETPWLPHEWMGHILLFVLLIYRLENQNKQINKN